MVTKAVRRKTKTDGDGGKYEFDSKSSDRDTGTEIGTAVTPNCERSGQLTLNAGGMVLAMESSDEHTDTAELLEKLPD